LRCAAFFAQKKAQKSRRRKKPARGPGSRKVLFLCEEKALGEKEAFWRQRGALNGFSFP
jgi:hypothetical protein